VRLIDCSIYHYGWVRHPSTMQKKDLEWHRFYDDQKFIDERSAIEEFDYSKIDSLAPFKGTHPAVMAARIKRLNWSFHYDSSKKRYTTKEKFKRFIYSLTGYRIGEYKNYRIV
jgi:hypothetical protein